MQQEPTKEKESLSEDQEIKLPNLEPKSSLNPINKKEQMESPKITYINQSKGNDLAMELSDEERQTQLNKLRDEYVQEKLNRKKQQLRIKKQEYGTSSSEQDDIGGEESSSGYSQSVNHNIQEKIRQNSYVSSKQQDDSNPLSKPQSIFQLKGKQNWIEQKFSLKQISIFVGKSQYQIQKIHKVKSTPQMFKKELYKLKLSYDSEQIMIGASKNKISIKKQKLSLHYLILASIITRKLQMMGMKFFQLDKSVPGVPESILNNCFIHGKIFKKSQILGRWEERLIVINNAGMYSYKRFNEKHSMFIASESVKEIWTRFEIVDQNLLVIKILHSSNTKTQFGIPITNFLNERNWLFHFYQMGIIPPK